MRDSFHVYILTNPARTVLYTGVTNDLEARVWQHREGEGEGSFTARYNLCLLVYAENFTAPGDAIAREKQIKGWRRAKKEALIATQNPHWNDLAPELFRWEERK